MRVGLRVVCESGDVVCVDDGDKCCGGDSGIVSNAPLGGEKIAPTLMILGDGGSVFRVVLGVLWGLVLFGVVGGIVLRLVA